MSEEKKEYDLFTHYNPEHYELSWNNYKITGFRTVAEYEAYNKGREHEQKTCFDFLKKWKIGETNSAFGAELQKKIERDAQDELRQLREENEELRKGLMFKGLMPDSKDTQIQSLTAEVEKLKGLLRRTRPYLAHDWGTDPSPEELKKEIESTLNHK